MGDRLVALAALSRLATPVVGAIGVAMIVLHNLLDGVHVQGEGLARFAWAIVHDPHRFVVYEGHFLAVGYPLLLRRAPLSRARCCVPLRLPPRPPAFDPMNVAMNGAGVGLAGVYVAWVVVVTILYFPSRWFAEVKAGRKDWWLSYL